MHLWKSDGKVEWSRLLLKENPQTQPTDFQSKDFEEWTQTAKSM